jgi:hypothetical protein
MVPVEAMASERPVIAYGRGGAIKQSRTSRRRFEVCQRSRLTPKKLQHMRDSSAEIIFPENARTYRWSFGSKKLALIFCAGRGKL